MEWISVKNMTPGVGEHVLFSISVNGVSFVRIGFFDGKRFRLLPGSGISESFIFTVTYWMPLPEPPEDA